MAFELARSGKFADLSLLERRLRDQGYSTAQLNGPSIRRQVRMLLAAASKAARGATLTS
jgi:adenylylsulfate kinase-like enzyme